MSERLRILPQSVPPFASKMDGDFLSERFYCLRRSRMKGGISMFKLKKESTEYENKSLRLPKDLIDIVQKLADENDLSFNKVVIQCIEYAIDNMENQDE